MTLDLRCCGAHYDVRVDAMFDIEANSPLITRSVRRWPRSGVLMLVLPLPSVSALSQLFVGRWTEKEEKAPSLRRAYEAERSSPYGAVGLDSYVSWTAVAPAASAERTVRTCPQARTPHGPQDGRESDIAPVGI